MALQPMYPGQPNSPQTELASAITDTDTTIPLLDATVLPDPPNIATIGTGEDAETILYTGVSGNDLTGVTRGFQGAAKSWGAGVKVARLFTEYDYDALRQNILSHASRHAAGGPDEITPESIGAETPAGAQAKAEAAAGAVQAELDAHLAETASKHIKESGSNPNGEYIRFDDGTQICWHTLTFTLNNQPGTTVTWTFPAAFKDNTAHVSGTVDNQSAADFGRYVVAARTKGTSDTRVTVIHINNSVETSEFEVAVQAVGRWK